VTVNVPDLGAHVKEVRKYIDETSKLLQPAIIKALKPEFPTWSIEEGTHEVPTVTVNLPASNVEASEFIPTLDLSELPRDKNGLPTFNISHLGLPSVQKVLGAFDAHAYLGNLGIPTDPKVINQTIDYIQGQLLDKPKEP
jgi:hypothetical protein